jgi:hypothetical protein
MSGYPYPPYQQQTSAGPPYNATNFTRTIVQTDNTLSSCNVPIYNTLLSFAHNSPNYPLPQDSNQDMIHRNRANIAYFSNMNQKTQLVKTMNDTTPNKAPYPQFKSEGEKIMYKQGLAMTAARNEFTRYEYFPNNPSGPNPSAPAGVPCSTIYGIIQSTPEVPG